MSIQLITYANQTVAPKNDAMIYEKAIDQNGIFYGCSITVSGNAVNITGGYGIICGREFLIETESIPVTLAPSGTLLGRLYVRMDLSDPDLPIQLLTATGNSLPALEQDSDVNFTNGTYEMELATFDVGVTELDNVVETYDVIVGNKTALNSEIDRIEFKKVTLSTGTPESGTVTYLNLNAYYNDKMVIVQGRYLLSGVAANARPYVTVSVPAEMPSCEVTGGSALRGSASSPVVTDPPGFQHTAGNNTARIVLYNSIGAAPAGYVEGVF